ncbi:MAG: DNA repair protein RadA, partial [Chloroflexi bacterium]|nr:DNA repair protein RadA [Chloroflexota bacterium]
MPRQPKSKTVFVCDSCGNDTSKWEGRCPSCGEWNTLAEMKISTKRPATGGWAGATSVSAMRLSDVSTEATPRMEFSSTEVNRVLGGGIVPGSVVLVAGDPGIGKSTLLLKLASETGEGTTALYSTGEESVAQVKMRADRMGIQTDGLYVLAATNVEQVLEQARSLKPSLVIVDSIQTMFDENVASEPGSVGQIRECTRRLLEQAKATNVPVVLSGHVTKGGDIAGPRIMEHMVDVVLYMEGDPVSAWRLLRSVKNRFGSTNEVGVFEMTSAGLEEVKDPSAAFIADRASESIGSVVIATLEGTRPLLAEVQALTSASMLPTPRRVASGMDFNRMLLVCAVLGRRAGVNVGGQDIVVNVTGGLHITEPAADIGVALAIASTARDVPLSAGLAAVGEVGLSGEVRSVPQLDRRIAEADRLGLNKIIVPARQWNNNSTSKSIEVVPVSTVRQALQAALPRTQTRSS